MSNQVPVASIQSYTNMVSLSLQQNGSKFLSRAWRKNLTGKASKAIELVGKVDAREKTTRNQDVELTNTPHFARWAHPRHWYVADMIDSDDKMKTLIDLDSIYIKAQSAGIGRKIDTAFVSAAFGTAYIGENGTSTEAWSTSYDVAESSQGMTLEKIQDGIELMMTAGWDPESEPAYLGICPKQYKNLMSLSKVQSSDFNGGAPVIKDGKLINLFGCEIVTLHPDILPITSTTRECILFAKTGVCMGVWDDVRTDVDKIPLKFNASLIQTGVTTGSVRSELGKVIKIKCSEA
jgi:hypothetical protein